ncbi:ATP-binding protein [Tessaracoccus lacteus]|uniref:PspC domain-containing protein n=1 Tax=Tessaracoccus lacteus TaxID=3041766 RepID=A0ABY8PVX6_9ACTN|nr:ATP-binding protein [Tessaracoccus sp. T21]WGT46527.1 PspC domain-containing protein [Tessaracoccus sp. T21]
MTNLPAAQDAPARVPLRRAGSGKVIAGVAQGLAAHLGINVTLVRVCFVIAAMFSGAGALAYGALWVLVPRYQGSDEPAGLAAATRRGMRPAAAAPVKPDDGVVIAGGLVVVGLLWLFVSGGVVPTGLFWPAVIGGLGVITIWLQVDERVAPEDRRGAWQRLTRGGGAMSVLRLVGGLVLVGLGISWILATQIGLSQLPGVLGASGVLLAGLVVVAAPWLYQQRARVRQADAERLRAEARADMAAHLHDSVLQTLALIQRQADDPATVAQLARRQERELRTWLYGETARAASLRSALREMTSDVEGRFPVDVELVCVGDATVDDRVEALIMATGEAVTNAAKHSGAPRIDVYAEAEDDRIEIFVRDRGAGFDPDAVPSGRMGVRESIKARMDRYGGSATIRSTPGEGTEVKLEISR